VNIFLWVGQALLALLFLMAGWRKIALPPDAGAQAAAGVAFSPAMIRGIGICEVLGVIGLILPAATHILPWLTIIAAGALALVLVLAALFHLLRREYGPLPLIIGSLVVALFVVYGRWLLVPFS